MIKKCMLVDRAGQLTSWYAALKWSDIFPLGKKMADREQILGMCSFEKALIKIHHSVSY